jgi:hypothetical protein
MGGCKAREPASRIPRFADPNTLLTNPCRQSYCRDGGNDNLPYE